jgi:hypothetical protein
MSSRKPEEPKGKPARKKLHLSKETLKDLTDAKGSVKGGAPYIRTVTCQASCPITCGPG